jgi:hypothetical protein
MKLEKEGAGSEKPRTIGEVFLETAEKKLHCNAML